MYIIVPFVFAFILFWIFLLLSGGFLVMSADKVVKTETEPSNEIDDKLYLALLAKFKIRLADIAAGKGNTAQAKGELENLGVYIEFALNNPDTALAQVLDGLSAMRSRVGQSSATTSIFGSALSSKLLTIWPARNRK